MASLPTGTVTFLFTDIEGSTTLLQRLGDRRYAEVLEEHRRLLREAFAEGHGQVVDTQGDAFLVAFSRAGHAVGTALAAQRALTRHAWPDGASLQVRMGLHTGEPVSGTGGYVGLDVHRAARICSAAHGGQILLSNVAASLAARDLPSGASLRDLGTHRLKDLKEPEHLFQAVHSDLATDFPPIKSLEVLPKATPPRARPMARRPGLWTAALVVTVVATVGAWQAGLMPPSRMSRSVSRAAPRFSTVALPFTPLGQADQSLADAVVQDLTTDLSRVAECLASECLVIAWSTAAHYKGKTVDPKQIGRELGVRYLLEGSVERSAKHVRINAQLISTETGYHLWAERFDRELGDLFATEDEIAGRIARTLGWQLVLIEAQRAERNRTSPEAMDYVLRARALWDSPISKDRYRQQQELLEQALRLDNHLALARWQLAGVLTASVLDFVSDTPDADLRRADELISQALIEAPNDPNLHFAKAEIFRAQAQDLGMQDRFGPALAEYETVLSLDRNAATALLQMARIRILLGAPAEAIPLLERVMRINPHGDTHAFVPYRMGLAHLLLGHIDAAIQWYEKALPTYPFLDTAYAEYGAALALKGDKARAQAALAEAARRNPKYTTIANIRRLSASVSKDPKWLALREQTIIKGLRKAGLPEQ